MLISSVYKELSVEFKNPKIQKTVFEKTRGASLWLFSRKGAKAQRKISKKKGAATNLGESQKYWFRDNMGSKQSSVHSWQAVSPW